MSKSLFYRLSKLPKYIKYIFPRENKVLNNFFKNNNNILQSPNYEKNMPEQILENDYSIEKCPKMHYYPRYKYTNLKKNTSSPYKNYGLPKKKSENSKKENNKNLDYNPEAEKFLFGK